MASAQSARSSSGSASISASASLGETVRSRRRLGTEGSSRWAQGSTVSSSRLIARRTTPRSGSSPLWIVLASIPCARQSSTTACQSRRCNRGRGRIVITGSGAAYRPGGKSTAYAPSKAATCRDGEMLANELAGRVPVFFFSPGLVRTELTAGGVPDDAPWTPPELAPELVRKLSTGGYDALAGRYLHAEHDDVDELLERIDEIRARDLNAIRLQR